MNETEFRQVIKDFTLKERNKTTTCEDWKKFSHAMLTYKQKCPYKESHSFARVKLIHIEYSYLRTNDFTQEDKEKFDQIILKLKQAELAEILLSSEEKDEITSFIELLQSKYPEKEEDQIKRRNDYFKEKINWLKKPFSEEFKSFPNDSHKEKFIQKLNNLETKEDFYLLLQRFQYATDLNMPGFYFSKTKQEEQQFEENMELRFSNKQPYEPHFETFLVDPKLVSLLNNSNFVNSYVLTDQEWQNLKQDRKELLNYLDKFNLDYANLLEQKFIELYE